jgi:hypothetical protein
MDGALSPYLGHARSGVKPDMVLTISCEILENF